MKSNELLANLNKGVPMLVGTYHFGHIEKISVRAQDGSGRRREAHVVHETILTETSAVSCERYLRDEENPDSWKPSAKKGQNVVIKIVKFVTERGGTKVSGVVEPIE